LETWDKAEADLKEAIEAFGKPLVVLSLVVEYSSLFTKSAFILM